MGHRTKTFIPMRQLWARSTTTITRLMHWNWSCFNIKSHSPSVSYALSTSQENNLTVDFFKSLFSLTLLSSDASSMRSNKPLLMKVTGNPVSMMSNAAESLTLILTAISLQFRSYTWALADRSVSTLFLLIVELIR